MDACEPLKELARQVRADTIQVLDAAQPDWLNWAPPGTSNHILWHAGHALWLQDLMCVKLLSGGSELPEGWKELFGSGSGPARVRDWPSREAVRSLLSAQLVRIFELLDKTSGELLSDRPTTLRGNRTVLGWILHGLHDEAKHNGEMYLLWKLCRQRTQD